MHEWGLFAVDAADATRAMAATEAAGGFHAVEGDPLGSGLRSGRGVEGPSRGMGQGIGTIGVKPVIYVHLDEGVDSARFALRLAVPSENLLERWPAGAELAVAERARNAGWSRVDVRRGACVDPTTPPAADSETCRSVRDAFCEAAEIPRYAGGAASCLSVADSSAEVLFYRAGDLPTQHLPLRMVGSGDTWTIERVGDAELLGPIFWLTASATGGEVHIRRLGLGDLGRPLDPTIPGRTEAANVRVELTAEAVRRGLSQAEAEAFVDAWSPAFFDRCTRSGPEASGTIPVALRQSERSLLYFAPESVIDAMLPLSTDPPARATHRVFLVRWVDGSALLPDAPPPPAPDAAPRAQRIGSQQTVDGIGDGSRPQGRVDLLGPPVMSSRSLSAEVVRRVILRHLNQIRFCYETALADAPDLGGGRLRVAFIVSPTGSVQTAAVEQDSIANPRLASCVAGAFRRWSFPAPDPEGVVAVRTELRFQPLPRD